MLNSLTKLFSLGKLASSNAPFRCFNQAYSTTSWQTYLKDLDPVQAKYFYSENLIKVDERDQVLGPISKGESHAIQTVKANIYHRALSLLIFDEKDRFLLTQRSKSKITFPNYFTNACCSHPLYNDQELEEDGEAVGVRRAVLRRSHYELGTQIDDFSLEDLKFMNKIAYRAPSDCGNWAEAEIDYIFVLRKNVNLNLNVDEVQNHRYVTRSEMKLILEDSNVKVTPWLRLLAKDHLFKYWDNLSDLDLIGDTQNIIDYRNKVNF